MNSLFRIASLPIQALPSWATQGIITEPETACKGRCRSRRRPMDTTVTSASYELNSAVAHTWYCFKQTGESPVQQKMADTVAKCKRALLNVKYERDWMRAIVVVAIVTSIVLLGSPSAFAQTGMVHGVQHSGTTKARCSPGDANVLINMKTKMYMMDTSSTRSRMKGKLSTMKSVCKSEAESMGAHMKSQKM